MKLIYHEDCDDLVKLVRRETRACRCGACEGRYDADGVTAVVSGPALLVTASNREVARAVRAARARALPRRPFGIHLPAAEAAPLSPHWRCEEGRT